MPLVSVLVYRAAGGGPPAGTGVQTVGTLTLPASGTVYIEFDYDLWKDAQAGVAYPLINYTTISGNVGTLTAVLLGGLASMFSGATFSDNGSGTISVTFIS